MAKAAKESKLHFAGEASRKAHMLRGTAASYGYPQISLLMGDIEDMLTSILAGSNKLSAEALFKEVLQCLEQSKLEALNTAALSSSASFSGQSGYLDASLSALIISPDESLDSMLAQYAEEKDVTLRRCAMHAAKEELRHKRIDMVFFEPEDGAEAQFSLLKNLRSCARCRFPELW